MSKPSHSPLKPVVVIVGAGQAGAQVAMSLRQGGFGGRILLIGRESSPPYQRPPLSKGYLKGEVPEDGLEFRPRIAYAELDIDLITDTNVSRINRAKRTVHTEDGGDFGYDWLVFATGASPRRPPIAGASLPGVHVIRSLTDVAGLKPTLKPGAHVVMVGAGYIGLETAAAARSLGCDISVIELADRVLARVAGPQIAQFYQDLHARQGVTIHLKRSVRAVLGEAHVTGIELENGEQLACDAVVFGVGVKPETALAEAAGLAVQDGILVDRDARTHDPHIFACGDCAGRPLVHFGRNGRLESVHNAIEQGKLAAAAILGTARPIEDVPWFWSDQYTIKLQTAGLLTGFDTEIVRGSPDQERFAVFYLREGQLLAVDAVNSPAEFLASKPLIARARRIAPDALRDTSTPFKQIATSFS